MTLTQQAARVAVSIGTDDLPLVTRRKAAACVMDAAASCLESLATRAGAAAIEFTRRRPGAAQAHVIGAGTQVDAESAAMANGILAHGLIREDMHVNSGCHPGPAIVPAMLAMAERENLSGEALLRGVVAGYQALGTLGSAIISSTPNRHFRPLGLAGAFGVTAACVAALSMDEEAATHALGLAANTAAGFNQWAWAGGQEIYFHAGLAARNGIAAFDAARAGLRSSLDVLEGPDGLFAAYGCGPDATAVFEGSARHPHHILDVTFKPIPGCNYAQSAASAARLLRPQIPGGDTRRVRSISIGTFRRAAAYPGCDNHGPFQTVEQAKMSIQFMVAVCLTHAVLDEGAFHAWDDPETARLASIAKLHLDAGFELVAPTLQPASVRLELDDGTVFEAIERDVPWLDEEAAARRFDDAAAAYLPLHSSKRVQQLSRSIWEEGAVHELCALLAQARPTCNLPSYSNS